MRFGIYLPHHPPSEKYPLTLHIMSEFAEKAEKLGFDSIWTGDHILVPPISYTRSYLDPLTVLTAMASRTERVKLVTNVLILPLRNPVLLAKSIATLDFFFPGRFILGVGPGHNPKEFEATGVPINERGKRTDEYIEIIRRLLSEPTVNYEGKFCHLKDVSIEPLPAKPPPIWVGGGSMEPRDGVNPSALSLKDCGMADRALRRIAKADGWLARGTATAEAIKRDWGQITAYAKKMGRDPSEITFVNYNYLHVADTRNREKALAIQRPFFEELMGTTKPWDYVQKVYLTGTLEDIIENIEIREKMGVELMGLCPVSLDVSQLEVWSKEIIPLFK